MSIDTELPPPVPMAQPEPSVLIEQPTSDTPVNPQDTTVDADDIFTAVPASNEPEETDSSEGKSPVTANVPEEEKSIFVSMPALEFDTPPHNVSTANPTVMDGKGHFPEVLSLPSSSSATQAKLVSKFPNLKDVKNAADLNWGQVFMQSVTMVPLDDDIDTSLSRPDSDWHQSLEHNGENIRSAIPRFKKVSNSEVSGEQGMQMAFTHMGMGDFFHTALYNSGFWVTFTPAPESVWLNINRILGTDVIGISRQTYGMLHSSATSLAISTIINSLLPFVYATSVDAKSMPVKDIPKYLSVHDEHDFIWGFIAANYPNGVSIERSCIVDPNACREVIKEKLNLTELQIVDRASIPMENKLHMRSRAHGSMSLESVKKYQDSIIATTDRVVTLKGAAGNEAKFILSIPSSEKKSRMSNAYVEEVQELIMAAVTDEDPGPARVGLYEQHMNATEMRMYQHWVKRIELSDDRNNAIVDEKTIASTLGTWTRDMELQNQFFDAMSKFINDTNLSAIGMEPAKCPKCGGDHTRPEQKLRGRIDYIPLDLIQVFSYLAEFKTRLISARG